MAYATGKGRKEASLNSIVARLDALIAQQQATNQLLSRLVGLTQAVTDVLSSCLPAIASACQGVWSTLQAASRHRAVADCACIANAIRWGAMLFSCCTLQHIARQHVCKQRQWHGMLNSLSVWLGAPINLLTGQDTWARKLRSWTVRWHPPSPLMPLTQAACQGRLLVPHAAGTLLVLWALCMSVRSLYACQPPHSAYQQARTPWTSGNWIPCTLGHELGPVLVLHVIGPTLYAAVTIWLSSGSWLLFLLMQTVWAALLLQPHRASTDVHIPSTVLGTHNSKPKLQDQTLVSTAVPDAVPNGQLHARPCEACTDKMAAVWSVGVTIVMPVLNGLLPYIWPWLRSSLTLCAAVACFLMLLISMPLAKTGRAKSLHSAR